MGIKGNEKTNNAVITNPRRVSDIFDKNLKQVLFSFSPPVIEEPKEPVDPAVRAKENWLRLYNKVLEQLREVRS